MPYPFLIKFSLQLKIFNPVLIQLPPRKTALSKNVIKNRYQ